MKTIHIKKNEENISEASLVSSFSLSVKKKMHLKTIRSRRKKYEESENKERQTHQGGNYVKEENYRSRK